VTLQSPRIVIDTAALYALVSPSDTFHSTAATIFQGLADDERELWTTSYVMVEAQALIHRRLGFPRVELLMSTIVDAIAKFWIDRDIHATAWNIFTERNGMGLSFVDWTTAIVARHLDAAVFTFDRGFQHEGIRVIPRLS
jgi:predicted nucleic acid-binding protein